MPEQHHLELRVLWSRSDRFLPRTVVRPLQEFMQASTAGSLVMLVAAIVAVVWANSPWRDGYHGSLAIAELAFPSQALRDEAKLAILIASLVAGVVGLLLFRARRPVAVGEVDGAAAGTGGTRT